MRLSPLSHHTIHEALMRPVLGSSKAMPASYSLNWDLPSKLSKAWKYKVIVLVLLDNRFSTSITNHLEFIFSVILGLRLIWDQNIIQSRFTTGPRYFLPPWLNCWKGCLECLSCWLFQGRQVYTFVLRTIFLESSWNVNRSARSRLNGSSHLQSPFLDKNLSSNLGTELRDTVTIQRHQNLKSCCCQDPIRFQIRWK